MIFGQPALVAIGARDLQPFRRLRIGVALIEFPHDVANAIPVVKRLWLARLHEASTGGGAAQFAEWTL